MRRVGHKGADLIAPGNTFESFEAARAYYFSAEYQAAKAKRAGAAVAEFVLVEGV